MKVLDMFKLDGKVAMITGGSVGLGAHMATGLAEAGCNVVVAARKVERCIDLCNKLEAELGITHLANCIPGLSSSEVSEAEKAV